MIARRRVLLQPLVLRTSATTTAPSSRGLSTAALTEDDDGSDYAGAYPTLFSPLKLPNGVILPNRVLMGSMHTGLEGHSIPPWFQKYALGIDQPHSHSSMESMATYFQERAEGGVGLMVTGGVAPNRAGWTGPFAAKLSTRDEMELHKVVPQAVHGVKVGDDHARICMQILHTGRYAYHPFSVSASSTKSPITPFKAKGLSKSGIQSTIKDFVNCASLAQEAGYDGVEIMASEGYLLSQFLSPRTNLRTDEYGGSLENRARLPLEILRQIRQACGDDFILIFRLSLLDLVDGGLKWDECVQLAQWVEEGGATIINTGIGWHEARIPTISTSVPRGAFVRPTAALKETGLISIPLVATNRINTPQVAEDILSNHYSDLVSMARPLLADPNFLRKAKEGKPDEINTCIACNQACLDHSFVGKTASCLVNPRAGHEMEIAKPAFLPKEQRRKIGVIGAGPAGCAFAITAAQQGHDVSLYDAQPEIGGQFHMAKRVPGKEEFYETLRYFRTMLNKHGVKLHLETTLDRAGMEANDKVEKWIVATGVHPRVLDIEGADHPNVLSYIDVLKHNVPVGKKVAIVS
jgi:2,4-dienoyl-CoA reductase (NADPH2)